MRITQNPIAVSIYNEANEKFLSVSGTRRWGQILWNTAEDYVKKHCSAETIEKLMNIKSTDEDCYYSDVRVENFVKALDRILAEEKAIQDYYKSKGY